ncbi:MAG: hypothetical protein ACRCX2_38845 [Paraclostridium sp.]
MAYPEEYQEKVDTVNDTLTKVLEDYVTKRNKYQELADARYASGQLDAPIEFEQEFNDYREAKQLLIDLMFAGCTVNQMVQRLDDFELI